jgi:hypothetical protein
MARPERHDVDYFPFFAKRGKTLNILQSKYGLEGIGFFTNLMRFLALTPDHYYCIVEEEDRLNLFAEIGITDEEKGIAIIELMVKTGKLDRQLWEEHKVIACEAFLKSLEDAYRKRSNEIITIEKIRAIFDKKGNSGVNSAVNLENSGINPAESDFDEVSGGIYPQRKEEKRKEEKRKEKKRKERFSFPEELNPSFTDFSQRVEKLRSEYNALKIGPPFKKTAVNLNPAESSDLMKIMRVYDDAVFIKAMQNYGEIKNSAAHDVGNCVYTGFIGFMIRGAEKFCDEASPFELFKRKCNGTTGPQVSKHQLEKLFLG